jgi:anti-sigma regulatory factor (Ser/Thr protein kinase)
MTSYSAAPSATVCATCSATLPEESKLHLVPGLAPDVSRTLAVRPEAAAEARRVVARLPLPETTRDALMLLVSELVTNSFLHAGLSSDAAIQLHLTTSAGQVRVAVHDTGPGFMPQAKPNGNGRARGGFGFTIVAALSEAWGVACDADGCTVWCAVAVAETGGVAAVRPTLSGYEVA